MCRVCAGRAGCGRACASGVGVCAGSVPGCAGQACWVCLGCSRSVPGARAGCVLGEHGSCRGCAGCAVCRVWGECACAGCVPGVCRSGVCGLVLARHLAKACRERSVPGVCRLCWVCAGRACVESVLVWGVVRVCRVCAACVLPGVCWECAASVPGCAGQACWVCLGCAGSVPDVCWESMGRAAGARGCAVCRVCVGSVRVCWVCAGVCWSGCAGCAWCVPGVCRMCAGFVPDV